MMGLGRAGDQVVVIVLEIVALGQFDRLFLPSDGRKTPNVRGVVEDLGEASGLEKFGVIDVFQYLSVRQFPLGVKIDRIEMLVHPNESALRKRHQFAQRSQ